MKIVVDRNIPFVVKAFTPFGEVKALPATAITRVREVIIEKLPGAPWRGTAAT